jgi:prevent-host-death family protein
MEAIMPRIGLRDLKTRASEVVRDVQSNQERYTITNRGVPVAVIIPYAQREETRLSSSAETAARLDALAEEISARWSDPRPVAELIGELRR